MDIIYITYIWNKYCFNKQLTFIKYNFDWPVHNKTKWPEIGRKQKKNQYIMFFSIIWCKRLKWIAFCV